MSAVRVRDDETFRILVLAGFSGRAGDAPVGRRRPVRVDRDSLDDAVRTLAPEVRTPGGTTLRFAAMDDFRPESLAARLPAVAELRALRDAMFDPRRAADAAETARARFGEGAPPPQCRPEAPPLPQDGGGLLDAILGSAEAPAPTSGGFENIVRDVAGPGIEKLRVPRGPADRETLAAAVDAEAARALRGVLHQPEFRALESAWRSVEFLVRRLDLGSGVELRLLDVGRDEAFADVGVAGPFDASGLHKVIVEDTVGTEGGRPWSLVVAPWAFDATARDVAALLRLSKLAGAGETTVVVGADPRVVGCRCLGAAPEPDEWHEEGDPAGRELWRALRRLPEAASVAVAWPRFLLRLPYGAKTSAVEGFEFEEFEGAPEHESLLWGCGAFAVAAVLGRAFEGAGPDFADAIDPEIDDLPTFVVDRDGEPELQPCAETWLRTRGVERATSQGLLPLLSVAGRPCVRLGNLDSLAEPRARIV